MSSLVQVAHGGDGVAIENVPLLLNEAIYEIIIVGGFPKDGWLSI